MCKKQIDELKTLNISTVKTCKMNMYCCLVHYNTFMYLKETYPFLVLDFYVNAKQFYFYQVTSLL